MNKKFNWGSVPEKGVRRHIFGGSPGMFNTGPAIEPCIVPSNSISEEDLKGLDFSLSGLGFPDPQDIA